MRAPHRRVLRTQAGRGGSVGGSRAATAITDDAGDSVAVPLHCTGRTAVFPQESSLKQQCSRNNHAFTTLSCKRQNLEVT
eukprot:6193483-Pleurochrysis_carterae.AAC.4